MKALKTVAVALGVTLGALGCRDRPHDGDLLAVHGDLGVGQEQSLGQAAAQPRPDLGMCGDSHARMITCNRHPC
jgi:hypothetical protein